MYAQRLRLITVLIFATIIAITTACGAPVALQPTASPPALTATPQTAAVVPATAVPQPQPTATPALVATAANGAQSEPEVQEYDLGPATIEQAEVEGKLRNLPYRIQGIIAVPVGDGPHPLVVITHGSHPGCPLKADGGDLQVDTWPCAPEQEQRNDLGWRYMVNVLSRQG